MLDNIMIFIQVVEAGSLGKAAKILNIQTSTVSKRLAELEFRLNKLLFIRDTRNINITEYGQFIYDRFRHLSVYLSDTLNRMDSNFNRLNKYDEEGELNLSMGAAISYELVCPCLDDFIKQYPKVKLNINFSINIIQWPSFDTNIVLAAKSINDNNLENRFLRTEYLKLYCSIDYALKYGIPLEPEELVNHKILGPLDIDNKALDYILLKNLKTNKEFLFSMADSPIRTNNALHMKKIGLHSDYIFGSWDSLCVDDLNNGRLIAVLPEWGAYKIDFYLTSRKKVSRLEQTFIDFIYNCMSKAYNKVANNALPCINNAYNKIGYGDLK